MAKHLGLTAVGWNVMISNWWNMTLASILLSSVILGSAFLLLLVYRKVNKYLQGRNKNSKVSTTVARYLVDLKHKGENIRQQEGSEKVPKSFGVFLGCFSDPPNPFQVRLLSQWDILVLDPLQGGVLEALSSHDASEYVLGRVDVSSIVKVDRSSSDDAVIRSLEIVSQTLLKSFKRPQDTQSPFTGVLLANWTTHFQPVVCNELIKYMSSLGLTVYLESSPPTYFTEDECRDLNLELTRGIVCRNATILHDGDRRDYFQMLDLQRVQRALARQPSRSGSTLMMWETVDDNVEFNHAVVKRSFKWCRFNNVISWIGTKAALTDAALAETQTVVGDPIGALMWLKDEQVLKSHEAWRLNDKILAGPSGQDDIYDSLHPFVPNLKTKLSLLPCNEACQAESQVTSNHDLGWAPQTSQVQKNPFSFSASGQDYVRLGCFQLGLDCSSQDFKDLIEQQRHLRDSNLLKLVELEELRRIGVQLQTLYDQQHNLYKAFSNPTSAARVSRALKEFIDLVAGNNGDESDRLRVYMGLQSGFRTSLDTQFWGLHDVGGSGITDLYISLKTRDRTGTILHTFLSSRGCTRAQCFMAELLLAEETGCLSERWQLPSRIVQDIEQLTPSETILILRRLILSNYEEYAVLVAKIRSVCEYQLIEAPSLAQLRALNSTAYLRGEISAEDLVKSRLAWYRERGCRHPEPSAAIAVFKEIDARFEEILMDRQTQLLSQLEIVLRTVLQENQPDAGADLLALSVFCACRKLGLSEVYLEILDRNPLPNAHPDQAACYAEMFATGSCCEAYFDMTPNVLGDILSQRYRNYYKIHQPPMRDDTVTELPTTYASMLVDLDPDAGPEKLPVYYQITFLGIFAMPALIDILLLTTVGRGLYLTSFMSEVEKNMATTALMVALLLCGGIGTWIGSGGTYYLHSMAFPAMNMFVLTRFIGGVAVCLTTGTLAFVIVAITKGAYAAVIFLLYFFILTTYLSMLATLAIYQFPGFLFQSGRMVIMACIPILFISPVLTLWVGHDIVIYLCVLYTFLGALLLGARSVISHWGSWYLNIACVSDSGVVEWYMESSGLSNISEEMADPTATTHPRKALMAAVLKEHNRRFWNKSTEDKLVKKLADSYLATKFLMDWYCKYTKAKMPYMYSPTWNRQCDTGIDTLLEIQKGLKLHNAFVHWRHHGDEVWCGVLYFIVALMDKWTALISGGTIVGLSAASSGTYRLAVGFGLATYLISAVFLDGIALPLWATANKKTPRPVSSLQSLRQVAIDDAGARRRLYWTTLVKFFIMEVYGLAVTSALMWSFEESRSAVAMYLAYMGAYFGLLWYQFNRIFTGSLAMKDLLIAAALGLLIGPLLHHFLPLFDFSGVVALGISTWTVAIFSIHTANIGWPRFKDEENGSGTVPAPLFYCSSTPGAQLEFSQTTLSKIYNSVSALPAESRYRIDPLKHPGVQIIESLTAEGIKFKPELVQEAFRTAEFLLHRTAELWKKGEIVVELVPARHLPQPDQHLRTVSQTTGEILHVFVFIGLEVTGNARNLDIQRNCKVIAEALIRATTESKFGLSHDHSTLAEMLAIRDNENAELSLPEGIRRHLTASATQRAKVIKNGNKALLRYLLLGLDCDTEWDESPETIRTLLLKRCFREPCHVSNNQLELVRSSFCKEIGLDVKQHIARCNLGVAFTVLLNSLAKSLEVEYARQSLTEKPSYASFETFDSSTFPSSTSDVGEQLSGPFPSSINNSGKNIGNSHNPPYIRIYQIFRVCMKFFVISIVADPEFQRELDFSLSGKPWFVHWPITSVLNGIWLFCKTLQQIILPMFLFHNREEVSKLYDNMKGMKTFIEKDRIVVESLSGPSTCFFKAELGGNSKLYQYSGSHTQEPSSLEKLMAVNTYTDKLVLCQREEYSKSSVVSSFTYEYSHDDQTRGKKPPIQRQCIQGDARVVQYDKRGYITSGSYMKDGNLVKFFWYYRKSAKFDDELLRAEYILGHLAIKVSWCVKPLKNSEKLEQWLPNSKVMQATFIQGPKVYQSKWSYDHRSHPVIETTLNGLPTATPLMIQQDWFHVLSKPNNCSFLAEDVLFSFSSVRTSILSRSLGLNTQKHRISTSSARTHLWKSWKNSKKLDAVTVRWLDDIALRSDRILKPYWRARDTGRLKVAENYLDTQADTVMARTDVDPDISSWTLLAYKFSDLSSFGQGGDATINTRTQSTQIQDSDDILHVLCMDTGTWPNEAGGVSACRRDMVNGLESIRWHVLAENANDFGLPKFQIEKNVQSLTILPLWGLDFLTPTHGVFQRYLDSAVQERSYNTTAADIKKNFLPILAILVRCSRAIHLKREDLEDATKALVDLNAYFQLGRHWSDVWMSDTVKEKWRELWLTEDMDNIRPASEWLNAEYPTLQHFDNALDMWQRYLFIFSVPVPERIPDVFQASHHFAGASYGVLCKVLRNCTLHVWDHCISWREVTVFLSSAMSFDPPFVCTSLMSLSRLTTSLILTHADVVLPCADFFNPGWEVELGTLEGTLEHRRTFARKIDPVVNGIANMEKYKPIEKIKSKQPTVSMLSHIRFVKDIKNAILAADIIVNEWGFEDYRLEIYGDMIKAPAYSVECQEIIAAKSLGEHVLLKGLGNPTKVLEDAWIFLNCSVSEGLPLAMGEAALTGVPVVCTDVGASFRVVTDLETGKRFSAVVAPNDSLSLAKAQINVLALLDEWSAFAEDEEGVHPKLSFQPTREEAKQITQRMYDKTEQRRRLGMMGRNNVLNSFSSDRYLREHEQMLWIGKYRSRSYNARIHTLGSYDSSRATSTETRPLIPKMSQSLLSEKETEEPKSRRTPSELFSDLRRKSEARSYRGHVRNRSSYNYINL